MENNFKVETSDIMIYCFEKMVGSETLVESLFQGNGKGLYKEISEKLGNENTKKVLDDNVNPEVLMLCAKECELKRTQENNDVPIM